MGGICYNKAVEQGLAHGQLPIREYFWMRHRKVLTINQVFEILLRVSEGKSFKDAFVNILPKRIEKVSMKSGEHENSSDEEVRKNSNEFETRSPENT
ncbi:hypothetical protein NQ318_017120 [Aromia moschata]|uniref:tRNA (guanine(9)-N(1))-methyltransferase n=1 Tax=Aromia moschata TaxID=1265417 RepID=A0AAV8XFD2_9CUCU|nr:hypothetical protein NQ318_017120 [Aromia moschata]